MHISGTEPISYSADHDEAGIVSAHSSRTPWNGFLPAGIHTATSIPPMVDALSGFSV